MHYPKISLIAAIGKKRELGKDNKLLWHIPEDMKRFKLLTTGHVVIMGRKTYESIGKPLPQRTNIIITKNKTYNIDPQISSMNRFIETHICYSLDEAIKFARLKASQKTDGEIFIIGGSEIYKQTISHADRLYLTIVNGTFDADTFFPDYSAFKKIIFQQKGSYHDLSYIFYDLIK